MTGWPEVAHCHGVSTLILPPGFVERPFTRREGVAVGMTERQLRSPYLHIATRGLRSLDEPAEVADWARSFAEVLPDDVAFSHSTACALWNLPMPEHVAEPLLHVVRDSGCARIRRAKCQGHRGLELRTVVELEGLRVVGHLDTWCDLAELFPAQVSFEDLVSVGDGIVNRLGDEGLEHPELAAVLGRRVRPRGGRALERAMGFIRYGSRSPMETRTRLMFVLAGFPEPRLNATVHDSDGEWLLTGDLVWDEKRVVAEYQGSTHFPRASRSHDADRAAVALDHGARLFEVFSEDVFTRGRRRRLLLRVARALDLDPAHLRID